MKNLNLIAALTLVSTFALSSSVSAQPEMSPEVARIVSSAQPMAGTPVIDLNNIDNNPENVQRVMDLVSETDFEFFFPQSASVYDYKGFLQAVAKFPAFCNEAADMSKIDEVCLKELATVFAHFTQETGGHNVHDPIPEWRQGLYHITEMGCSEEGSGCEYRGGTCEEGTWQAEAWPCAEGQKYYGRGAKQLSYNYNYGQFSDVMFGDVNVLLQDPDRVAREGWLAMSSAIWFAMTPQAPKPSIHEVVTGFWQPNERDVAAGIKQGFGATTLIINGGIECGGSSEHAASANRIKYYTEFAEELGIDPGTDLGCAGYNSFPMGGSGAVLTFWEKDWVQAGACKAVGYQTAYSIFKEGDYDRCVEAMWGESTVDNSTTNNNSSTETETTETTDSHTSHTDSFETSLQEDLVSSCIVVTSWWPGECGVSTDLKECNQGWGTFESVDECCDQNFPDSESCGSELSTSETESTTTQERENTTQERENMSESTEEVHTEEILEDSQSGECRSAVPHIADAWCQAVACDDVYIDAGFCITK